MARASATVDIYAYADPDPVTVARLIVSHGVNAALSRWHWKSRSAILQIGKEGREILRARSGQIVRSARRTTTPEAEDRILRIARALGSVSEAARNLGVSESLVRTLHRERGLEIPLRPVAVRIARAVASRKRNAAAKAERPFQPRDLDPVAVLEGWRQGRSVKEMAAQFSCSVGPIYRLIADRGVSHGVPKKLPDDAVIRADIAAGMTQTAMAVRYGTTRGAVCHRIAAMALQGCSALPRTVRRIPDDATLIADRAEGLTLRSAAARYGVARSVVGRHWQRLGIGGRWSDFSVLKDAA